MAGLQGNTFTGDNGNGVKRQFAVYVGNIVWSSTNNYTMFTLYNIGLRKVSSGTTNLNYNSSYTTKIEILLDSEVLYTINQTQTYDMTGTPPVNAQFHQQKVVSIARGYTTQTKVCTIRYTRSPDTAQYAGTSEISFNVTVPAKGSDTSSTSIQGLTAYRSNYSGSPSESGGYIYVGFSLSDTNYQSASGTATINGTSYSLTHGSGTSYYCIVNTSPASANVSVSVTLSFEGGTTRTINDSTYISGTACAIDVYYGNSSSKYNVGIGTRAREDVANTNLIDIAGTLYINGVEYTGGGGGGEPAAYLKSAVVSGNTLSLTNKDDSTTSYTPTVPTEYIKTITKSTDNGTLTITPNGGTAITFTPAFTPSSSVTSLTSTGMVTATKFKSTNYGTGTGAPSCRFGTLASNMGEIIEGTGSTRRIKHDIKPVENEELNPRKLYDIPVCQFKFNLDYLNKEDERYNTDVIGIIAEDVDELYPVACDHKEDGIVENWNERYLIPAMLKLIQEQHEEIETLKAKVDSLIEGRN